MQKLKPISYTKYFIIGLVAVVFSSCSKNISFQNSAVVPVARGDVKVKKDKNSNYAIDVTITELAEVERLQPPKKTYIVWMVTDENVTKNIGQLNSKQTGLAKKLKANFKTVTPSKPVKIFLTAEDEPNASYPADQIILTTDSF
jgi:hypothetical protein